MNKVLSVLAVVAILGVSFYAGHKSFGSSVEYEHQDVIDLQYKCGKGSFIGGCKACSGCKENNRPTKYKAGGCSYFKDTFCTLCTSIQNCLQQNTFCTTKDDQYCDKCEDGFFGPKCTACRLCSSTEYVAKACVSRPGKKDQDTVCQKCTQCTFAAQKKRSFLTKTCNVGGNGVTINKGAGRGKDSKCRACRVCLDGFEYTQKTCESPKYLGLDKNPVAAIQKFKKKMPMDTKCTKCTGCMAGTHPDKLAWFAKNSGEKALYATQLCKDGKETIGKKKGLFKAPFGFSKCATCSDCKKGQYISKPCDPGHPHKEWRCKTIKNGKESKGTVQCKTQYDRKTRQPKVGKGQMLAGTVAAKLEKNTKCADCTARPAGHWTVFPCNSKHTSDAVHQKCSTCQPGEYKFADCKEFSDTVCPSCPNAREKLYKNSKEFKSGLQYCQVNEATGLPDTECTSVVEKKIVSGGMTRNVVVPRSTKCGKWLGNTAFAMPKNPDRCLPWTRGGKCGEWKSNCKKGFYGESCCYHKHPYSCGVLTTRERSGKRMKYPTDLQRLIKDKPAGRPKEGYFAQFCMSLCSEFPDCLAVEIEDKGTFANPAGTPNEEDAYKKCFFKSSFTQDQRYQWKGAFNDGGVKREGEPQFDCYSNTCRQNLYKMAGGKPLRIINYKIPKTKQTHAQKELAIAIKECAPKCKKSKTKKKCMKECKDRVLLRRKRFTKGDHKRLADISKQQ